MYHPKVSGIIATDIKGNIANKDGNPILHGTRVEDLDRAVLNEYLRNHTKEHGRAIFVVGRNTFNQMRGLLTDSYHSQCTIVSSPDEIWVSRTDRTIPLSGSKKDKQRMLLITAFREAFANRSTIYVLGGKSVYEAFAKHYSHFVHVEYMMSVPDAHTQVQVFYSGYTSDNPALITKGMNLAEYRLIDNGEVRVTEHTIPKGVK